MPAPTIRAVNRALTVIRLLAEERRPLGIAEISEATGLAPATVHRILATLVSDDWVEQNPRTSRYRLGFGLLGTAAAALNYTPLVEKARVTLRRVSEVSGYNSWLGVLVGRRIAYLAQGEGRRSKLNDFNPGIMNAAHATCGGRVLLANLPVSERRRLYRGHRQLRAYTSRTITDLGALEADLERVREAGYAIDPGQLRESWFGVAVPVRGADGGVIAALLTGTTDAPLPELEALVPELRFLAEELLIEVGAEDD